MVLLLFGSKVYVRRYRKRWQEEAREERPPKTCRPYALYCRRVVLKFNPHPWRVSVLKLGLVASPHLKPRRTRKLRGEVRGDLNEAIAASRRGATPDDIRSRAKSIANDTLHRAREWLKGLETQGDIAIDARLEDGEASCEFFLYRCVEKGEVSVWEEVDKWKSKVKVKRDVHVCQLDDVSPSRRERFEELLPGLADAVVRFIKRVSLFPFTHSASWMKTTDMGRSVLGGDLEGGLQEHPDGGEEKPPRKEVDITETLENAKRKIQKDIDELATMYQGFSAGGFQLLEIVRFVLEAGARLMEAVEQLRGVTGAEKKQLVMSAVRDIYKRVSPDIPLIPEPFETWLEDLLLDKVLDVFVEFQARKYGTGDSETALGSAPS